MTRNQKLGYVPVNGKGIEKIFLATFNKLANSMNKATDKCLNNFQKQ